MTNPGPVILQKIYKHRSKAGQRPIYINRNMFSLGRTLSSGLFLLLTWGPAGAINLHHTLGSGLDSNPDETMTLTGEINKHRREEEKA